MVQCAPMPPAIPAIISVDVEPAGFQADHEPGRSLDGFAALVEFFDWFRRRAAQRTGRDVSIGWFFRMDPQIESVFGRADHLATAFPDLLADLSARGDHFGLHTHPVRWSTDSGAWIHDLTDAVWVRRALDSSFEAFARCFGVPCQRHRMGASLFNQVIADALAVNGARVDTSLESIRRSDVDGTNAKTAIDDSPLLGPTLDCSSAPRRAYWPAPDDFRRRDDHGSALALVPMTTTWLWPRRAALSTVVGAAVKRRARPKARVLSLSTTRRPPEQWRLVARQLRLMRRPYLNLAVRTDLPGTRPFEDALAQLENLVEDPLMSRLHILDPIEALPALLDGRRPRADRLGSGRG